MPAGIAKLYILVICVVLINLLVLVAFGPCNWKRLSFFDRTRYHKDVYLAPNTTRVVTKQLMETTFHKPNVSALPEASSGMCPAEGKALVGPLAINHVWAEGNYWSESHAKTSKGIPEGTSAFLGHSDIVKDGQQVNVLTQPDTCVSRHSVAFVIPFRNRKTHLKILLGHLIPILHRQLISFSIFVVEQVQHGTFNKGRLMNTGFNFAAEAGKRSGTPYDCYIFHDVDMLSEYDTMLYRCAEGNKINHLSTRLDKFDYRAMCCGMTVGGVLAIKEEQFHKVNGYPTAYWGWGGEDDDMYKRILSKGIEIVRPQQPLGRFSMIRHDQDDANPRNMQRFDILNEVIKRTETEGLSNLDTRILKVEKYPLFTKILVDVGKLPS